MLAAGLLAAVQAAAGEDKDRPTPPGLPVPRYVSLKFDTVNARSGPGDDYKLQWVYRVRGLPVQVVAETDEWRRICDPDGGLAWVHKRTTDGRRTAMRIAAGPLPIHAKASDNSRIVAYLARRAIAPLDRCKGDWCKLKAGSAEGWAQASLFWGAAEAPQCR